MNASWEAVLGVVRTCSPDEWLSLGAVGHWSVKDALIHVTAWDAELIRVVDTFWRTGEKLDYGTGEEVDRLNEAQVEGKRTLSINQVCGDPLSAHQRLREFLESLPDAAFDPALHSGEWIRDDSHGHYEEHGQDIERWACRVRRE